MENFTLTTSTGSAVFNGTTVDITDAQGNSVVYSVAPTVAPTVVDVTQGEELQINETEATPAAEPVAEAPAS